MENALRPVELSTDQIAHNEELKRKNEIRNTLSLFFIQRDCSVLFRPVADERKLRDINHMDYELLRPQFRMQLEELIRKVFLNLKPKIIEGQAINGSMFAELTVQYVQAMNSDRVPTISSAWERVIDAEVNKMLMMAVDELNKYI